MRLPDELLLHIISYLDDNDISKLSSCNRRLKGLCNYNYGSRLRETFPHASHNIDETLHYQILRREKDRFFKDHAHDLMHYIDSSTPISRLILIDPRKHIYLSYIHDDRTYVINADAIYSFIMIPPYDGKYYLLDVPTIKWEYKGTLQYIMDIYVSDKLGNYLADKNDLALYHKKGYRVLNYRTVSEAEALFLERLGLVTILR